MAISLLFLGCFILYGKSKYFPDNLIKIGELIKQKKQVSTLVGYLFLLFSFVLLVNNFGLITGIVLFLISISFTYSLLLIVLPINKGYLYFIALVSVLLIIFENVI